MRGGDSHDNLLRRLRDHQAALIERIARGNTPPSNDPHGYMHVSGQVVGLDVAIQIVREVLFGERPPEPQKNSLGEYYGVI